MVLSADVVTELVAALLALFAAIEKLVSIVRMLA